MDEKFVLAVLINLLDGCETIKQLKDKALDRLKSIDKAEQEDRLSRNPIGGKHATPS